MAAVLGPRELDDDQNEIDVPSPAPVATKTKRKRKAADNNKASEVSHQDLDDDQDEMFVPSPAPVAAKTKRKRTATDIKKGTKGFPKPCPDSAICGVTKDFANYGVLYQHSRRYHDSNWPEITHWPEDTSCNFPGCQLPRDHYFGSREAFRRHLSDRHMLSVEQAREYVGKNITVVYKAPRD